VERIPEERNVKEVFKNIPEGGKNSFGRPRKRKLGDVENYFKKMSVRGLNNSW
jgi:hypothetical protein